MNQKNGKNSLGLDSIFGGQPSITQPIAGPCDSPHVVNLNIFPKVLKDIAI